MKVEREMDREMMRGVGLVRRRDCLLMLCRRLTDGLGRMRDRDRGW
jgi:hypothetical protein